jgi:pyruvate dehydrogenase E2 component (dihydrolipoamide acetyltransferase)
VVDENDTIEVRPMMSMTLSVDHRIVDGAVAAQFLADLVRVIENPDMIIY